MGRHKIVDGVKVDYSAEEETQRDAEEKLWAEEQVELAKTKYQRDRKAEYPPMENYLDGIVKGDQAQIDQYVADCLAVKQRFPK